MSTRPLRHSSSGPDLPDELFATLDGCAMVTDGGTWRIEIQSIFDDGGYRWIQFALDGMPRYSLTFRIPTEEDARAAVLALSSWLTGLLIPDDSCHSALPECVVH